MNKFASFGLVSALIVAPVIALLFSLLCMITWGTLNDTGYAESTMAVGSSWLWIFINPIVGYLGGVIACWLIACSRKKHWRGRVALAWPACWLIGLFLGYLLILWSYDRHERWLRGEFQGADDAVLTPVDVVDQMSEENRNISAIYFAAPPPQSGGCSGFVGEASPAVSSQ